MAVLMAAGCLIILLGLILAGQGFDNYWHNRGRPSPKRDIPPFIYSTTQCHDCGQDDELLNLQHRCIYCHERAHNNG